MSNILNLLGMTVGGWLGWALGAVVSTFTAFILSMVGTGIGLYAARRVTRQLLP